MRIALDGRALVAPRTGIGWYTYHLLRGFASLEEEASVDLLLNRPVPEDFGPKVHPQVIRFPNTVRLRAIWEKILLPARLRRGGCDVWHSPMTVIPSGFDGATVATVHDIAFLLYPEIQPPAYSRYWTAWTRAACERADKIIAVSHSTRRDLLEHFEVDASKVEVVHEAADPFMTQAPTDDELAGVRIRYSLPDRFLLFVGTLEPRKNLGFLLDMIERAKDRKRNLPPLFVVGGKGWLQPDIEERIHALGDLVRPLGYLDREEIRALYSQASAVLVPSLYEGFGLQAAEAMAAGAAVLASDLSSLPEVVGEDGFLLPVDNPEAWIETIENLLGDPALHESVRKKAREQAATFSWDRAASETYWVYERAISYRSSP